jgi:hypothetical protein
VYGRGNVAFGVAFLMVIPHVFLPQIPRVNVEDELEIREVFFGEGVTGKSYVVLCSDETSKIPISSVFQDAFNDGSAPAEFRLIDCNYVLQPSGKSIAERFGLDMKKRPTIFLSGAVGEPKQIPTKHLKTGAMLVKLLKGKLEPHAGKIETTQDLRVKCLDKDICGLVLKGTAKAPAYLKDAMQNLLKEFPKISFAAVDSSVLYVKNLEEYLPGLKDEQPRFVVFKKVSGSLDKGGDRLITSIAPLPTNGVSYGSMSNLVASVVSNTAKMEKIPVLPTIKTRTKKLEQEEQAKRDRKSNRSSGAKDTPAGAFRDNDGTAEGRKAERDRRRAEHRKDHNVREKTPEEIAEMERQRRIRMEEEAAKWNMAPDDLPDAGEPFTDEGDIYDDYDEDEDRTTTVEDVDEDAEDGDDVLDLD